MSRRPGTLARRRESLTGLVVHTGRSRHGVEVHVAPMPGFTTTYALLAVRYGALDTHLPDGRPLPEGTAHFLEHRMMQKETGDLFDVFDARGAHANAFTTHTSTSYLFWCADRLDANLDTLLSSVAALEVEETEVARERGIIRQEIAMYDDDPYWVGYVLLMRGLYRKHPVRADIAGTVESIAEVDKALLEAVHRVFYHPRNQVLVVAGHVDPHAVLARLDDLPAPGRAGGRHRRRPWHEGARVAAARVGRRMPMSRAQVLLGMKDAPVGGGARLVRRQLLSTLALDALFQDGGRIQARLYDEGLVDDALTASYESEADFGHAVVTAEVDDVEPYRRRLGHLMREAGRTGVSAEELERSRRRLLGLRLRAMNGPEPLVHWILGTALEGVDLDVGARVLASATPRAVTGRLRALLARPRSWAVLDPA